MPKKKQSKKKTTTTRSPRGQKGKSMAKAKTSRKRKQAEKKLGAGTIKVRPGYIVVDTSTATGGVHYQRKKSKPKSINRGKGVQQEIRTTKTVDHEEAVKAIDALVKRADYACRTLCANTAFGWFVDDIGLRKLYAQFDELRTEAEALNRAAAQVGSERRAHISVIAGKLELSSPHAAREIARTVREVLTGIFDALRAGQVKKKLGDDGKLLIRNELHAPLLRAKNLDKLAMGPAGDAIKFALDRIPAAKKEILELLRNGESPEDAGAAVDLTVIENAIIWFEENADDTAYDAVEEALAVK